MKRVLDFCIIPIFLFSEVYYLLHFIGLRVYCTGTTSAHYRACYPICRELGDRLFLVEMFLLGPLILLLWFLTIQRRGKGTVILRSLSLVYLLLLRFVVASAIAEIEIKPCHWIGRDRSPNGIYRAEISAKVPTSRERKLENKIGYPMN